MTQSKINPPPVDAPRYEGVNRLAGPAGSPAGEETPVAGRQWNTTTGFGTRPPAEDEKADSLSPERLILVRNIEGLGGQSHRVVSAEQTVACIRQALEANEIPFHANDNISALLNAESIQAIQDEVARNYQGVLNALLIDTKNDPNSQETANRVAKMLVREVFRGRYEPEPVVKAFPNDRDLDELYVVGPLEVKSTCSHHHVPIIGKAWVGIYPGDRLSGLSKFSRLLRWVMRRPQIQEEATVQFANIVQKRTGAKGVGVVIQAQHHCMCLRGVEEHDSMHTTSVMLGALRESQSLKKELFDLIKLQG